MYKLSLTVLFLLAACETPESGGLSADPKSGPCAEANPNPNFAHECGVVVTAAATETGGSARSHFLNYYDIPVQNGTSGELQYLSQSSTDYDLVQADTAGLAATVKTGDISTQVMMSYDGQLTWYTSYISAQSRRLMGYSADNSPASLGNLSLDKSGLDFGPAIQTSTGYLFPMIHRPRNLNTEAISLVTETGSYRTLALGRTAPKDFHRVRLNPVFSNILFYVAEGSDTVYVVDTSYPGLPPYQIGSISHPIWSPDGLSIGGPGGTGWNIWSVISTAGHVQYNNSTGNGFTYTSIANDFGSSLSSIFYGTYSDDGQYLAVSTDSCMGGTPDDLYLINVSTGAYEWVLSGENTCTNNTDKLERIVPAFYDGTDGIAFHSNQSGTTQVYMADIRNLALP